MHIVKKLFLFILLAHSIFLSCSPVEDEIDNNKIIVEIDGDQYILKSNSVSLGFKKHEGKLSLSEISNNGDNWIYTDSTATGRLWQVTLNSEKNDEVVLNSEEIDLKKAEKINGAQNGIQFQWEFNAKESIGTLCATVKINNSTQLSEWELNIEVPESWEVTDVIFPIFKLNKATGMELITPSGWGAKYNLSVIDNLNLPLVYPSSRATTQLICLNKNQASLYFSTHDKNANLKMFSASIGMDHVDLSLQVTPSESWHKDKKFSIPWSTLAGFNNNGWEDAVSNWYRPFALSTTWGQKSILNKNIPTWLLDTDLWLTGGRTGEDEFRALSQVIDYFGSDTKFHWYYWSSHDFDTNYPEYFPAREDYDRVVDTIHEYNSRVMPYSNGRLWDTSTSSYQSLNGKDQVVIKNNGQAYMEIYASGAPNAVVCPSSKAWNEIVTGFTGDILSGSIKNDALYYDQVASASALPCYNANHDHPVGGGDFWHYSYRKIFNDVRKLLGGEQIIATEQNAECYLDLFDLFYMVNIPRGNNWEPAPIFPLVYSDRALTYGFYLQSPNVENFRAKNALSLLWGAQLSGGPSLRYAWNSSDVDAPYLKGLKLFREKNHDLFVGGRFIGEYIPVGDNPLINAGGWDTPTNAVRGAKWQSVTGNEAIIIVNIDVVEHKIILPTGFEHRMKPGECIRFN